MKIDEAKKILANDLIPNYPYAISPQARAIQLGIEALKRLQKLREDNEANFLPPSQIRKRNFYMNLQLLPGETSE